jgi:hypothetical protein
VRVEIFKGERDVVSKNILMDMVANGLTYFLLSKFFL